MKSMILQVYQLLIKVINKNDIQFILLTLDIFLALTCVEDLPKILYIITYWLIVQRVFKISYFWGIPKEKYKL